MATDTRCGTCKHWMRLNDQREAWGICCWENREAFPYWFNRISIGMRGAISPEAGAKCQAWETRNEKMPKLTDEYRMNFRLQPCCADWCRDWHETHDGKYPASDHAPGCANYKPVKWSIYLMPDGGRLIAEPMPIHQVIEWFWNPDGLEPGDKPPKVIGEVMLTEDQVEKMPEYEP